MGKFKEYGAWHLQRMKDPIEAAAFFKAALDDALKHNDRELFLDSARDILRAGGPKFLHSVIESLKPAEMGQMIEGMVCLDVDCRDEKFAPA